MNKLFFATKARGFLNHLFENKGFEWTVIKKENIFFETKNRKSILISRVIHWEIFDIFPLIQVINCFNKGTDIYGSFNRFLKSDKPYFIYLENPTAVYHYRLHRNESFFGKRKIKKLLYDENLKAVICMSKACLETLEDVCCPGENFDKIKEVVYPFIPKNNVVTEEIIIKRCKAPEIKLLYIAQGIRFVSKGAPEIIEAFRRLRNEFKDSVSLTIITSFKDADKEVLALAKATSGITLLDFKLTYKELEKIYTEHAILLHPTSDDSFGLTILEGMKAGLPVISTTLYAISEMVKDGINGFLTTPKWWFFDEDNKPNPKVWNNRKRTLFNINPDIRLVNFIYENTKKLINDRGLLQMMSFNSFQIANSPPFDELGIVSQWNNILQRLL